MGRKRKRSFCRKKKCPRVRMANLVPIIAALSFLVTGCLSQPGGATRNKCPPKPPTIQESNATEYLGIWYEQRRFPAFFQLNTRCVRATYGPCPDPDQPGACDDKPDRVSVLNVATKANGNLEGSYWILETDYHNYSVVYSCTDFLFGAIKLEFAWILAREQHLDPDMLEHATQVLVDNGIDITPLEDTVQNEECVYERNI